MARKLNAYLAVYAGAEPGDLDRVKLDLWDMMRYDQCFPVSLTDGFPGWLLFCQPYRSVHEPGFRLERWASFGVIAEGTTADNAVVGYADADAFLGLPVEMEAPMRAIMERRGAVCKVVAEGCFAPPRLGPVTTKALRAVRKVRNHADDWRYGGAMPRAVTNALIEFGQTTNIEWRMVAERNGTHWLFWKDAIEGEWGLHAGQIVGEEAAPDHVVGWLNKLRAQADDPDGPCITSSGSWTALAAWVADDATIGFCVYEYFWATLPDADPMERIVPWKPRQ